MPSVGFEPTIPAFERVKTVHALDRAATVIGKIGQLQNIYWFYASLMIRYWCLFLLLWLCYVGIWQCSPRDGVTFSFIFRVKVGMESEFSYTYNFFFGSTDQLWEREVGTSAWFGPIGTPDGEMFQITLSTLPIGSNRTTVQLQSKWSVVSKNHRPTYVHVYMYTHTHAHEYSPVLLT
jgi:hypothetical protein